MIWALEFVYTSSYSLIIHPPLMIAEGQERMIAEGFFLNEKIQKNCRKFYELQVLHMYYYCY